VRNKGDAPTLLREACGVRRFCAAFGVEGLSRRRCSKDLPEQIHLRRRSQLFELLAIPLSSSGLSHISFRCQF
jgi:hypothetical protein